MSWAWTTWKHRAPGRCRECHWYAWRKCRVCDRWVCRNHRHGYGNWFRCEECPAEAMVALMRAHHEQVREEYREAVLSGKVQPPPPAPPARVHVRHTRNVGK